MASIKQRGESYQISVYLGRDEEQKRLFKTTTYRPKARSPKAIEKEVQAFAYDFEQRVRNGEVYSGDAVTFSQFIEVWKKGFLAEKTQRVQEDYLRILRVHFTPAIGFMKMNKIKATHIDNVLHKMKGDGRAAKTIRSAFTVVNSVMKYAYKKEYIRENPCDRCDDLPSIQKDGKLHVFTKDQVQTFFNALTLDYSQERKPVERQLKNGTSYSVPGYTMSHKIPLQFQVYFHLAITVGLRRGETIALTWKDVDFRNRTISVSKSVSRTEKEEIIKRPKTDAGIRVVPVPDGCLLLLRRWQIEQQELCLKLGTAWKGFRGEDFDENYIFIDRTDGSRMCLDAPSHKFNEILNMYNSQHAKTEEDQLPYIRLHDLRHTYATLQLAMGTPLVAVSHNMGHSKTSVTLDIYTESLRDQEMQAADAMQAAFYN